MSEGQTTLKIGVGISTFNRPEALHTCIAACAHHNYSGYRIFITDDGSTPENERKAREIAQLYGAEMERDSNPNIGVAGNCNRIIAHFEDCDYIAILMDDGMPISDAWMSDHIRASEETGIKIFTCPDGNNRGQIYKSFDLSNGNKVLIQQHIGAPLVVAHRDVWDTIGGYDSRMHGIHWDDIDFMGRAIRAGFGGGYTGNAIHPGHPSLSNIRELVVAQDVPPCMDERKIGNAHNENNMVFSKSCAEADQGNLRREYK